MIIHVPQADKQFSESQIRFLTFFNYFRSIQLSYSISGLNSAAEFVRAMKELNPNLSRKRALESAAAERLQRSLYHSWNSQVHLEQYRWAEADYIALSLQWLPTMFYYAFYHTVQAYFAASGKEPTPNHKEVLKVITADNRRFPGLMGALCTKVFTGPIYSGLHIVGNNDSFSNLSRPSGENCQNFIAKFLKTTREDAFKGSLQELRLRLKRKNLSADQKSTADDRLSPIGIPHFLYRVRKRFNYEDSEIVHLGNDGHASATDMYRAIRNAYFGYIVCSEWLAATYAGKNNFNQIFTTFKNRQKSKMAEDAVSKLEGRISTYF